MEINTLKTKEMVIGRLAIDDSLTFPVSESASHLSAASACPI